MKAGRAFGVTLLLAATGCGTSQRPPPAAQPEVHLDASPTWGGCQAHVMQTLDYAADASGSKTLGEALAPYREPGDHLVRRPARDHRNPAWLLVDERNVIRTAVEVWHADGGWLVSLVDRCDD